VFLHVFTVFIFGQAFFCIEILVFACNHRPSQACSPLKLFEVNESAKDSPPSTRRSQLMRMMQKQHLGVNSELKMDENPQFLLGSLILGITVYYMLVIYDHIWVINWLSIVILQ